MWIALARAIRQLAAAGTTNLQLFHGVVGGARVQARARGQAVVAVAHLFQAQVLGRVRPRHIVGYLLSIAFYMVATVCSLSYQLSGSRRIY